jgi:hypothetical protein
VVWLGPLDGLALDPAGVAAIPPPLDVRPELKPEDVDWLNAQMAVAGRPPVTYARALPPPPVLPAGVRPPVDTSWITMATVRG